MTLAKEEGGKLYAQRNHCEEDHSYHGGALKLGDRLGSTQLQQ